MVYCFIFVKERLAIICRLPPVLGMYHVHSSNSYGHQVPLDAGLGRGAGRGGLSSSLCRQKR